ncbi:hypothetical protein RND81_01G171100 [Saponaria officinalis]|uniref:FBD domain-containing protein n=1 Tax=Saponaria officinalis TaxID=3572 RepID=A0AAW1NEY0_SAPOF
MESRTKKMIPSEGTNGSEDRLSEDRLSEMPDHLIVHILSFMPTLDAVKTMLLRRFGNLWTLVPSLTFHTWEYDEVIWPDKEDKPVDEVFSSFARFIRNVLMLHKRPTIDSFHLYIISFGVQLKDHKSIDDVQMWLRFAIDRQVKDLNFYLQSDDDLVLPHCIFMSQSLTKLILSGCIIEHQPQFHMGSLRELSLADVVGSGQVYNQLILGCPSLQKLDISISNLSHVLNITSPSVRSLVKALLTQIQNVEAVTLSGYAFAGIKTKFPQTKWKRLVLWPCLNDDGSLEVILELMKSSVKLEELIIYNHPSSGEIAYGGLESSTTGAYLMTLLKKVTIHGCGGLSKAQLQLVEIVLQNAVLLEQLVITGMNQLKAVDELNLVKQISKFRRASAKATVIFD